jgi:hypothetical protein
MRIVPVRPLHPISVTGSPQNYQHLDRRRSSNTDTDSNTGNGSMDSNTGRRSVTPIEPFVDESFGKYAGTNKAELPSTLPGGHDWEIARIVQALLVKQPPAGALN